MHGPVRVDPANPHHFRYADGTPYFLLGYEINWLWAFDMTAPKPKRLLALLDNVAGAASTTSW